MSSPEDLEKRQAQLKQIRDEIWGLTDSPLYDYRTKNNYYPVIGEGNHFAKIMFIGEAPGKNEAETGKPFCGAAGRILDELCASIGLNRSDVYVTNIVKDRPPNNRDPLPKEIEIYAPFLDRQIQIIQPDVIATLGRFSMSWVLNHFNTQEKDVSISYAHGKKFEIWADYGLLTIVPLYHPAVALYKATQKQQLLKDFQVLKNFL
jgi:uracil-DNA glycosylase family 4